MPHFNALTPMFWTREIDATVAFYTEVLGFECALQEENWAVLIRDEVEVMVSLPNPNLPFDEPTFTGSFYINTTSLEELWKDVKDKCNICYPIENFEYGMREFAIFDNNNYIIQFGQPIND